MKVFKKILKVLLIIVLLIVLGLGGLIGWLSAAEYKPADVVALEPVSDGAERVLPQNAELNILGWNIGYAALGAESDFLLDGGENLCAADRADVDRYLAGIKAETERGGYDVLMLQEVDTNSKRTFSIDEAKELARGDSFHALNYSCPYVPNPSTYFINPFGRINSGLETCSVYEVERAERIALPCPFSWPLRTVNLKRCLLVSYLPIEGSDRQLVLVNLHLEAYDDGEGKAAQTKQLMDFLAEEYAKGNYVIAGGDFNQTFPGALEAYPIELDEYWVPGVLEESALPEGFSYVYDLDTPSCRLLNRPYDPADTENTQHYVIDGFIVSDNVEVTLVETLDLGFENSDHNPVHIVVRLK